MDLSCFQTYAVILESIFLIVWNATKVNPAIIKSAQLRLIYNVLRESLTIESANRNDMK